MNSPSLCCRNGGKRADSRSPSPPSSQGGRFTKESISRSNSWFAGNDYYGDYYDYYYDFKFPNSTALAQAAVAAREADPNNFPNARVQLNPAIRAVKVSCCEICFLRGLPFRRAPTSS